MKSLIVNADDFGYSARRNAGILEAHRRGIVQSASLMANGAAWKDAVRLLREAPDLDVGIHVNVSEGEPLVAGHRTLVGPDGLFHGKEATRRFAALWRLDRNEIERETEAQIRRLLDAGLRVTHLDGHQHLHIYRPVAEPIARAARKLGIGFVRSPVDRWPDLPGVPVNRVERSREYRERTLECMPVFREYGLRSTSYFGGASLSEHLTLEHLLTVVRFLPEGATEFMVHPGFADDAEGFSGRNRERELRILTDPRIREALEQEKVRLVTFRDL